MRITWAHGLTLAGVTLAHALALQGLAPRQALPSQGQPQQRLMSRVVHTIAPTHAPAATQAATLATAPPPAPAPMAIPTPGHTAPSLPTARVTQAPLPAGHLPADQLDWPALPRSAPDTTRLDGHALSGLPLTLRLYIDAQGRVIAVQALTLADDDRAALPALQAMFAATAYSPGRRQGRDVASTLDLALGVTPAAADELAPATSMAWQHAAAPP